MKNTFTYTGRCYDEESGLYHYRNRMYSPTLGRFMQRDPAGFVDGYNLYAYVANNPLAYIDPYGLARQSYNSNWDSDWASNPFFSMTPDEIADIIVNDQSGPDTFGPDFFDPMDAAPDRNITQLIKYTDSQNQYSDWNYTNSQFNGISVKKDTQVVLKQNPMSGQYVVLVELQQEVSKSTQISVQGYSWQVKSHNGFQHYGTAEIRIDYDPSCDTACDLSRKATNAVIGLNNQIVLNQEQERTAAQLQQTRQIYHMIPGGEAVDLAHDGDYAGAAWSATKEGAIGATFGIFGKLNQARKLKGLSSLADDAADARKIVPTGNQYTQSLGPAPLTSRAGSVTKSANKSSGRSGKQARLREMMNDPNVSSADRGWLRNDARHIEYGNKSGLRVPRNGRKSPGRKAEDKGYELAHPHNAPASQGNSYAGSKLKNHADHKVETRLHKHRY